MQYSTNYNFNLPEGTDLWNYLTQTNPNFTSLDTILKGVSDATVTTATEVASGTAHAITRTLPDANVIRFTATSNWVLGDTMTIDGTPVTVVKPNGTNLQSGDYVIGAEVLGVLRATQFTVYLGAPSSLDASDITYDNTGSGLTATDVQDAIDEVNSNLVEKTIATGTGTTNAQKLQSLFSAFSALSFAEKINSYILLDNTEKLYIADINSSTFSNTTLTAAGADNYIAIDSVSLVGGTYRRAVWYNTSLSYTDFSSGTSNTFGLYVSKSV